MSKIIAIGNVQFEEVRSVTRPVLKIEAGKEPVAVLVQSVIRMATDTGEGRAKKGDDGKALPPPELMDVVNLVTGEESVVVVNSVLGSELREKYPNDSYVDKAFYLAKTAPNAAAGKRYATFTIKEVRVKTPAAEAQVQTTLAPAAANAVQAKSKGR